jgi:acetyl-CoA C-acetyltransferase
MESKNGIVMVSAVRTPFSKFDSAMADIPSIDLGVMVMKEVIEQLKILDQQMENKRDRNK